MTTEKLHNKMFCLKNGILPYANVHIMSSYETSAT